jgi:hypothetical protein
LHQFTCILMDGCLFWCVNLWQRKIQSRKSKCQSEGPLPRRTVPQ